MKVISTTEARKNFSEIINQVKYSKKTIAIGRNKKAEVLIVPIFQEDDDLPISSINAASSSFKFLADEPDLYSITDIK